MKETKSPKSFLETLNIYQLVSVATFLFSTIYLFIESFGEECAYAYNVRGFGGVASKCSTTFDFNFFVVTVGIAFISSLVLYGFGTLLEYVKEIKESLVNEKEVKLTCESSKNIDSPKKEIVSNEESKKEIKDKKEVKKEAK